MQLAESKSPTNLCRFNVGVVGASNTELEIIERIFAVTHCRTRSYKMQALDKGNPKVPDGVDFIVLCSANPLVIAGWRRLKLSSDHSAFKTPFVYLTRSQAANLGAYQLTSPVNPAKLIRLLDGYTIKE